MFDKVVVAVDGSSHSRKAIQTAAFLAPGGQLVLVHSVGEPTGGRGLSEFARAEELGPSPSPSGPDREGPAQPTPVGSADLGSDNDMTAEGGYVGQTAGEAILEQARRDAQDHGATKIDTVLTAGDPARQILKVAADVRADAIVLGSRGRSDFAGLVFGSTSHKVLHLSDRTCIVVR